MGYGEYGGGGSVHWLVDADEVDDAIERGRWFGSGRRGRHREWRQHGVDYHGKPKDLGNDFTIRVKVPEEDRQAWLAELLRRVAAAGSGDILEFTLPIVNSDVPHTQIQICWGKTCGWEDNLYRLSSELRGGPAGSASPE